MFAEERQAEIAELVLTTRRVNGADLARRFDVTMETVRRDLAALEAAGRLRRVHGGAVSADQSTSDEKAISSRKHLNTPEKRRIAQAAFEEEPPSAQGARPRTGVTPSKHKRDYAAQRVFAPYAK